MKFRNTTKNSVQLDDINLSIPYEDGAIQEIDNQSLKKSFAFQKMISLGGFEVVEAGNDRLEQNLLRICLKKEQYVIPDEEEKPLSGLKTEIILRGHFYESSGYAKVNRNLAINLVRNGMLVEIDPISMKNSDVNEVEARILSMMKKKVGKAAIFIDSVIPTQAKPSKQPYNILYTTAETNAVPLQFVEAVDGYDELWVTSKFSQEAFLASGVSKKIVIIPPVINNNLYHENVAAYEFRPKARSFVYTSVLSWGYRKGSDALIRAFCKAFSGSEDVSLVLLITEKSLSRQIAIKDEISKIKADFSNPPHILCCMKHIPEYQMPSFYKACNVFILPSRGEGFGLPYCEASLCGLPVISTNYGGQLDFLKDSNSFLVDIDKIEVSEKGQTGIHYWDGYLFPSLKSEDFIERLAKTIRIVYSNYSFAKDKNKKLQSYIQGTFSGERLGLQLKTELGKSWKKVRENNNASFCRS